MSLDEQIAQMTNPQEFTRLCNTVLAQKYGQGYQIIDGARSDGGNDGYIIPEKRITAMHCPIKPESKTDAAYLRKIRSDLGKAKALKDSGDYEIENWSFITPRKLSNAVIEAMRKEAEFRGLSATHLESTFLSNELLRNKHLIEAFPEFHNTLLEKKLDEVLHLLKNREVEQTQEKEAINSKNLFEGEVNNKEEYKRLIEIRRAPTSDTTIPKLKALYYKSTDQTVKINAILGLVEFFDPLQVSAEEMVCFCDEGIATAENLGLLSAKSRFLALKGFYLSFLYTGLDSKTSFELKMDNAIGFQTISEESLQSITKRLKEYEEQYTSAFNEALDITKDTHSYSTYAYVLMYIGNAAGQRAMYLHALEIEGRATLEKTICRRALLASKEAYSALGDEIGVGYALLNLANQIRFVGEQAESLELVRSAKAIALRYNERRLLQRTNDLIKSLETDGTEL